MKSASGERYRLHRRSGGIALLTMLTLCGCQSAGHRALQTVSYVDIPRFMGDWYVIASIPTRLERNAYDALESYQLSKEGRVLTVFTFHAGSFDGPLKRYTPIGTIKDGSQGAVWGMQFIWPIKAEYRVMYVDAGYTQTVIGRQKRDYAWIMARQPTLADADYVRLSALLQSQGYDISRLRRVPQRIARPVGRH